MEDARTLELVRVKLDQRIGTELGGYRIVEQLGRGGTSVVYRAEHVRLGRGAALKLLSPGLGDADFGDRFLRESRLAASLDHPNIVPVYDAGEDDGLLWIAMACVEGTDLKTLIADEGRLPVRRALSIVAQIASALDAAHARGLVHRDVKPANILLADDGRTMLTGFGLGTIASFSNGPGAAGPMAPDYVAPERLVGREVDSRADVYSLAAVIFHAVTGQRPFTSRSWIETLSRRLYEPPPSAKELMPELPEEFGQVLQQAMDRDPSRRPATAGELLQGLSNSLDPPEPTEEPVHWLHPHMHRGSMVVSGLLVLVVGVAGITWFLDGEGLSLLTRLSHLVVGR